MKQTFWIAIFFQMTLLSPLFAATAEELKVISAAPAVPSLVSWDNGGNRSVRESRGGSFISWESARGATRPSIAPQAAFMNAATANLRRQYEIEESATPRMVLLPKAPPASSEPVTPDYMTSRSFEPTYADYGQDVATPVSS